MINMLLLVLGVYPYKTSLFQAAAVLVGIPLETGQKQYSVDYKLETYLKIARLFLEDDDPIQAEAYINRASLLQGVPYVVTLLKNESYIQLNPAITDLISLMNYIYLQKWPYCFQYEK